MANLKGAKPDKLMRNALALELHQEDVIEGVKIKRLRRVAKALVDRALEGDIAAIREINERMDGKVPQALQHTGDEENPIAHTVKIVL